MSTTKKYDSMKYGKSIKNEIDIDCFKEIENKLKNARNEIPCY